LQQANNVTSSTVKSCDALMELSQKDQQCIYSIAFYVAIASPSVALLMVVVVILSAYKLRRRRLRWNSRGGGGSSRDSRGRQQNITKEQTHSVSARGHYYTASARRREGDTVERGLKLNTACEMRRARAIMQQT